MDTEGCFEVCQKHESYISFLNYVIIFITFKKFKMNFSIKKKKKKKKKKQN